jgi:hypothetical protein
MADEQKWSEAEAHWRKHHSNQPYADKNLPFEQYAPAYRTGHEAALEHTGKKFEEIEGDLALDYEKHKTGSALAWDTVRPAVKAEWDRLGGVIGPRDTDRGIRSGM